MISVLSNLITAMCHAFIPDKALMPPQLNFDSESPSDEGAPAISNHEITNFLSSLIQVSSSEKKTQFGHFSLAFQHCNWHDAFVHAEIRFQPDTFSTYSNFRFQPDALFM